MTEQHFAGFHDEDLAPLRSIRSMMREGTQSAPAVIPDGVIAGLFMSRSDVAAVARLLDVAGTTLCLDPAIAGGLLARASTMIASMLQASGKRPTPELKTGGMAPWQVLRVQTQIDERLHEPLRVNQLAESVRLSTSYFTRAFKISFGCSLHAYILLRRIDRAKALISGTATTLAQVCLECGLADQAHLSRIFRRHVGCTPSDWRRGTHPHTRGTSFEVGGNRKLLRLHLSRAARCVPGAETA